MDPQVNDPELPGLAQVRAQFELLRAQSPRPRALPEELWSAAATLAKAHGVHRISKALRLNNASLKRRVSPKTASPAWRKATFVSLPGTALPAPAPCIVDLVAPSGARMNVRFFGPGQDGLFALARAFLGHGP